MEPGLTFDTGALVALSRRDRAMRAIIESATAKKARITIPTVVLAEWSRGAPGEMEQFIKAFDIEPLFERLATQVARLRARMTSPPSIVDVAVVLSASGRGDIVFTSDVEDLTRIRDEAGIAPRELRIRAC